MKTLGVIPARYGSTRFPGKPLALIAGKPMIQHVYEQVSKSSLDDVVVATDDLRIIDAVKSFGGEAMMTREDHPNGTCRVAEVALAYPEAELIINIQGDEPLIDPKLIDNLVNAFEPDVPMVSVKKQITSDEEINSPDCVKVVTTDDERALYFSRATIPFSRDGDKTDYYKHIGIYGYERQFLFHYIEMPPAKLEHVEKLEQLRVLENGYVIKMVETDMEFIGVDRPEDIARVEKELERD